MAGSLSVGDSSATIEDSFLYFIRCFSQWGTVMLCGNAFNIEQDTCKSIVSLATYNTYRAEMCSCLANPGLY